MGLSATLPNYRDVAAFLRVHPSRGLFHADDSFRPVPLTMQFVGVSERSPVKRVHAMNELVYERVVENVQAGHQVMVFVHSRKDTVRTAEALWDLATENNTQWVFDNSG